MIRGLGRVFRWYAKREARRAVLAESANEERIILGAVPETCREPLTEGERREYDRQWGWLGLPPSYREAEVFKHFNGFDARYLSHYHYLPLIARRLNDYRWTKRFEHKALLGFFSGEALRPPKTFACAIAGEWYDGDLRQIDFCEAVERCAGHDAFVCKPASESADGHGVRRIERGGGIYGCVEENRVGRAHTVAKGCRDTGGNPTILRNGSLQRYVVEYIARNDALSERMLFSLLNCLADGKGRGFRGQSQRGRHHAWCSAGWATV